LITVSEGLSIGFVVLEQLRNDAALKNTEVYVECFQNCRENGLTFTVHNNKGEGKTWCVYEHRNSDDIIVNSKNDWTSFNGDLPYKADSKWVYDMAFRYDEISKCADYLKKEFLNYAKKS